MERDTKVQRQTTIASAATVSDVGLHTGERVRMVLRPAPAGSGVVFVRRDVRDRDNVVRAHVDGVTQTRLGTVIANEAGVSVATVEHLMSALAGLGVDNLIVELDGPETPILDGSADAFVALISQAGLRRLPALRAYMQVLEPVEVRDGDKWARLEPCDQFEIDVTIDFASAAIGAQRLAMAVDPVSFVEDIGRARTFGFAHEIASLQTIGLARGGSLDNAILIDGDDVVNEDGLRFPDEFVRHKALDAIGDLALVGAPLRARYVGYQPGHALNIALGRALLARAGAFAWSVGGEPEPELAAAAGL